MGIRSLLQLEQQDSPLLPSKLSVLRGRLTHDILHCDSATDLGNLVQINHLFFDAGHVSLLTLQLSRSCCAQRESNEQNGPLWAQLDTLVQHNLPSVSARQLAVIMYANAKARRMCSLFPSLLELAHARLLDFTPQGLSMVLYSCAALGYSPSEDFLRAACAKVDALCFKFRPQDITMTLWSLARLEFSPSADCNCKLLATLKSQLQHFNNVELITSLWALAKGAATVRGTIMKRFAWVLYGRLQSLSVSQAACMLWSMHNLAYVPNTTWLTRLFQETLQQIPRTPFRSVVLLLYSLLRLDKVPPAEWLAACQAHMHGQKGNAGPIDLVQYLRAAALKRCDGFNVPEVLSLANTHLARMGPREYASLLYSVAKLGLQMDSAWYQAVWQVTASKATAFDQRSLSITLWSMSELRAILPRNWIALFLYQAYLHLPQCKHREVVRLLWAVGRLGYRPPPQWMERITQITHHFFPALTGEELCGVIVAFALLQYSPGQSWLDSYAKQIDNRSAKLHKSAFLSISSALKALKYPSDALYGWIVSV